MKLDAQRIANNGGNNSKSQLDFVDDVVPFHQHSSYLLDYIQLHSCFLCQDAEGFVKQTVTHNLTKTGQFK